MTKLKPEPWRRLQQGVELVPGESYTLSAWLRAPSTAVVPGLEGWGDDPRSHESMVIVGKLYEGDWTAQATGDARVLDTGSTAPHRGMDTCLGILPVHGPDAPLLVGRLLPG